MVTIEDRVLQIVHFPAQICGDSGITRNRLIPLADVNVPGAEYPAQGLDIFTGSGFVETDTEFVPADDTQVQSGRPGPLDNFVLPGANRASQRVEVVPIIRRQTICGQDPCQDDGQAVNAFGDAPQSAWGRDRWRRNRP